MDAPPRGALMLVCFAAVALITLSLLEFGLYWFECHNHQVPLGLIHCSLLVALFILGVVILVRARAIAQWVDNKLDE